MMVLILAKQMGIKTICTEHSHFVFNDLGVIPLNKLCKWYLKDADAAICVSHASRDNFTLRAKIDPHRCFTIPNAVDTNKFQPNPSLRFPLNTINIVIISRLAHKKGIDLLVDIIPEIVARIPNAYFIIRGFGEKYELLE